MKRLKLIIQGLIFYRRTHLGVLLGAALSIAILTGALLVGDSVSFTLRTQALSRLGATTHAMNSGNRFIGDEITQAIAEKSVYIVAPVLNLPGMARNDETGRQVNRVAVLGINGQFAKLFDETMPVIEDGSVVLGAKLAEALGVSAGDEVTLRAGKPSALSADAPLSSRSGRRTSRKALRVQAVASDAQGGRFGLAANQTAPYNAFVNLEWLQQEAELDDKANIILLSYRPLGSPARSPDDLLNKFGTLEDLGLDLTEFEESKTVQLSCDRVFFDSASIGYDEMRRKSGCAGVLTYLADAIYVTDHPGKSTPYSFISAIEPSKAGIVPEDMQDHEIIINRWLADQLNITRDEPLTVKYSVFKAANVFEQKSQHFIIRDIVEMDALKAEREMLPAFPGLTDVENCSDWDIGMPVDGEAVKDRANEEYWDKYGATPKAFVTLEAGQEMWGSVFGDLTAVRFAGNDEAKVRDILSYSVSAQSQGFFFVPVREQALRAVDQAMDLGQLFLGMSFFLIAAGMMLTGLLFAFGIQQRAAELGVLRAVGWTGKSAGRLLMHEGLLIAVAGAFPGMLLGAVYTRLLIAGLSGGWGAAVAGTEILFYYDRATLLKGSVAGILCALFSMWVSLRWLGGRKIAALLKREIHADNFTGVADHRGERVWKLYVGAGLILSFSVVFGALAGKGGYEVQAFFVAGLILFSTGIGLCRIILGRIVGASPGRLSVDNIGRRNAARRCGRSLTVIGLAACGTFLVLAVSSMKEDMTANADRRRSGTGGFELYGETAVPVLDERSFAGKLPEDVDVIMIKLRDGDDAGCLNLNRAQNPRLLGVDAARMKELGAFVKEGADLWDQLLKEGTHTGAAVPALVGDSDTALWGLKKKTGPEDGEMLDYVDESGRAFKIKLSGQLPMRLSVFHGSLLISREDFNRLYPSEAGYRIMLVDAPEDKVGRVAEVLTKELDKEGAGFYGTVQRLQDFYAVETAYLSMFLVLGGLGLLLGSAGMGLVVLRNVFERRSELAMLRAVGYSKKEVSKVVVSEHMLLLNMGVITGAVAAMLSMWPSLANPAVRIPYVMLAVILIGTWGLGTLWIHMAVRAALTDDIIGMLRNE